MEEGNTNNYTSTASIYEKTRAVPNIILHGINFSYFLNLATQLET